MKIYTRSGDGGETGLLGNVRVPKSHPCIDVCGQLDELNSVIGLAVATGVDPPIGRRLTLVQQDLFDLGGQVAAALGPAERGSILKLSRIAELESEIDELEEQNPPLQNFILPGGSVSGAHLHWARTVCRRVERRFLSLLELDTDRDFSSAVIYLNRLSDYLFVAARWTNQVVGHPETPWTPTKLES